MPRIQNVSDVKTNNLQLVLNYILAKEKTNPTLLQHDLKLSWGSVSNSINELLDKKIILDRKMENFGRRGKKGSELYINEKRNYIIGLSLLRSGLTGVVTTLNMKQIYSINYSLDEDTQESFLNKIYLAIDNLLNFVNEKKSNCIAIGIAIQGIVDSKKGISTGISGFKSGWHDVPIAKIIEDKYHVPTFIEHDPQCDLTYECYVNDYDNAIFTNLDSGIGLAVVQNGKILTGRNQYQIGYLTVYDKDDGYQPMEKYCCLYWMSKNASTTITNLLSNPLKYESIFKKMIHYLALCLSNLHSIFCNDLFILSGPLVECKDYFFDDLIKEMNNLRPKDNYKKEQFILSKDTHGDLGAAIQARRKVLFQFLREK